MRWIGLGMLLAAIGCHAPERVSSRGDEALYSRAGYPQEVKPHARPTDTGHYTGYQVGGGAVTMRKSDGPAPDDGTWGWDYCGHWLPSRIVLGWWHGRRYQGGVDGYKTDGPRPVERIERRCEGE